MDGKDRTASYFMLGFHRIFIIIRSSIRSPHNISLLCEISKYCLSLKEGHVTEFETFKTEIIRIVKDDAERKELLENALKIYEVEFITDNLIEMNRYLSVISETALEICTQLRHENFERAYDLLDAIHCLPEAIISKKQWNSKAFWKMYIRPYREKWDNQFLSSEERELQNTGILGFLRHNY